MSLKRIRGQLERHAPDPERPLPYLVVSCEDQEHDPRVRLIQINGARLTFPTMQAARAWIASQDDRPAA